LLVLAPDLFEEERDSGCRDILGVSLSLIKIHCCVRKN